MGNGHFILAPSGASRWWDCPGSLLYDYTMENESNPLAEEGTFAHAVGALCLTDGIDAVDGMSVDYQNDGEDKSDIVNADMAEYVNRYVEYCRGLKGDSIMIEERLNLDTVYGITEGDKKVLKALGITPDAGGTADFVALSVKGRRLDVADLKYGQGVEVFAKGNKQGGIYGCGALEAITDLVGEGIVETVRFTIFQPRIKKEPDVWEISVSELMDFQAGLQLAVRRAMDFLLLVSVGRDTGVRFIPANEYFCPSDKTCAFCLGKGQCAAQGALIEEMLGAELSDPASVESALERVGQLSDEELGKRLPVLDMVAKLIKVLWTEAHGRMMQGRHIPGQKLVFGKKGARKWKNDAVASAELKRMKFLDDDMYDKKVKGPAKIEKVCSKKNSKGKWKKLQKFIEQKDASLTIVPEDDPRQDQSPASLETEFDKVQIEGEGTAATKTEEDELNEILNG